MSGSNFVKYRCIEKRKEDSIQNVRMIFLKEFLFPLFASLIN